MDSASKELGCEKQNIACDKASLPQDGRILPMLNLQRMKTVAFSYYELRGYLPDFAHIEEQDFSAKLS